MFRPTIVLDMSLLTEITSAATNAPRLLPIAYRRDIQPVTVQILEALQKEPGKPSYPLQWKSDRQRKFVMAMLRRQGNLPYQRTGLLLDSYQVELLVTESSGILQIVNDAPEAKWVVGEWAQPMFLGRWVQMSPVADAFADVSIGILLNTWFDLLTPYVESTP